MSDSSENARRSRAHRLWIRNREHVTKNMDSLSIQELCLYAKVQDLLYLRSLGQKQNLAN